MYMYIYIYLCVCRFARMCMLMLAQHVYILRRRYEGYFKALLRLYSGSFQGACACRWQGCMHMCLCLVLPFASLPHAPASSSPHSHSLLPSLPPSLPSCLPPSLPSSLPPSHPPSSLALLSLSQSWMERLRKEEATRSELQATLNSLRQRKQSIIASSAKKVLSLLVLLVQKCKY